MPHITLQHVVHRLQTAIGILQQKITALKHQNSGLQQKITTLEADVQRLQLENHSLKTSLENTHNSTPATQHIRQQLDAIIDDVEKLHHSITQN